MRLLGKNSKTGFFRPVLFLAACCLTVGVWGASRFVGTQLAAETGAKRPASLAMISYEEYTAFGNSKLNEADKAGLRTKNLSDRIEQAISALDEVQDCSVVFHTGSPEEQNVSVIIITKPGQTLTRERQDALRKLVRSAAGFSGDRVSITVTDKPSMS